MDNTFEQDERLYAGSSTLKGYVIPLLASLATKGWLVARSFCRTRMLLACFASGLGVVFAAVMDNLAGAASSCREVVLVSLSRQSYSNKASTSSSVKYPVVCHLW